jgi:hypothetical protein
MMGEVVPMAGRVVSLAQIGRIEEQENPQMARSRNSGKPKPSPDQMRKILDTTGDRVA